MFLNQLTFNMKRAPDFRNYFDEYLEVCHSISPKSELLALRKLVKEDHALGDFRLPSGICLIDYSKRQYAYISECCQEIHSYPRDKYVEGGLDFHTGIWVPEDWIVFEEQVFRDIRKYWKLIPPGEIPQYRFSFNHRYYRSDGTISQFLQHGTYMEPQAGLPLLNLVVFSDIGDYKTDNSLVLTVSHLINGFGYVKVFSRTYLPQRKSTLSVRELEVLRLALNGLSSKMIAHKLFISEQTVKNHKANMMEKTFAKNIAELISLSLKNKWI